MAKNNNLVATKKTRSCNVKTAAAIKAAKNIIRDKNKHTYSVDEALSELKN